MSFLPMPDLEGINPGGALVLIDNVDFVAASALIRWYLSSDGTGFHALAGTGFINYGNREPEIDRFSRVRAVTVPIGVGWRAVWGGFSLNAEVGVDIPLYFRFVDARYLSETIGSPHFVYLSSIPGIFVLPRVTLTIGGGI
jgi:hypothetical protein